MTVSALHRYNLIPLGTAYEMGLNPILQRRLSLTELHEPAYMGRPSFCGRDEMGIPVTDYL